MHTKPFITVILLSALAIAFASANIISFASFAQSPKSAPSKSISPSSSPKHLDKEAIKLSDFIWEKRLVLIHSNAQPPLMPFMRALDYESLAERKLDVYALINQEAFQLFPNAVMRRTPQLDRLLKQTFHTSQQDKNSQLNNKALLIGLDGSVKAQYSIGELDYRVISKVIDGMPMRRAELSYSR
ncbi:DUF4174 domain-containing protein [Thalassotalea euphylliae]|uniref:DUF4174 domain-containing protein n=1 Tax=Thalassotalea euphylliae TaxID=1655234 RepID=A0A3E0TSV2_9GAMM|nr:DUF4174 domain-containing protein [Thalassotalea euphylliae]REL27618.1 DUF4174 domain-containing protein [Thalassotalea euphylliae]